MLAKQVLQQEEKCKNYAESLGLDKNMIKKTDLFLQSFVHKSFAADTKEMTDHNERLEFLGDGILWAVINKILFLEHPEMPESELTLYKIALVREENLAQVARDISLENYIFISKGEERTAWRKKNAILADCLESLLWYLYIDMGSEIVENFIKKYIYSKLSVINIEPLRSYKTMVQELTQKHYKNLPVYEEEESIKDDKNNILEYISYLTVNKIKVSQGKGSNKKKAQEDAAKNYYCRN